MSPSLEAIPEKHGAVATVTTRGAILVEFLMAIPAFLLICFGIIQYGLIMMQRSLVFDSFSSVVREISLRNDPCVDVYNLSPDATYSPDQIYNFSPYRAALVDTRPEFRNFSFLAPSFEGSSTPMTAIPCQDASTIRVRFSLDFDLRCPLCRLIPLGSSAGLIAGQFVVYGIPESVAATSGCFSFVLPAC
jgi:hypothetical protein